MSSGEHEHIDRRAFLASCLAPFLPRWAALGERALPRPWQLRGDAAQQDTPVSWERAVDGYLEGDLQPARRALALPPEVLASQANDRLETWMADASDFRAEVRRRAVRRLQAAAACALELPQPLTMRGRSGAALLLESIAHTALNVLAARERPGMATPADRKGRSRDEIRRAMAVFRGRWHVAYLQMLLNDRRMAEAYAIAERIALPDGDRALPEAHYLRGLVFETNTRLIPNWQVPRADDLLPPSRVPWINGQLGDAAGWYRRALDSSRFHQEARLHLGRVELERGHHARAIEMLQPLREQQVTTWIGGLAWLFTGASYVALGSLDDAQRAFDMASQVPDVWQSGRISLMQLALRRGDLAGAADTSSEFAAPHALRTENPPDAWLVYVSGRRQDDNAVLEPMREAILP